MAERYVHFNVAALMWVAVQSVRRHHCVSIAKLDEGYSNKAFLLTMDDGYEVIARIPMLKAGVPKLTTASDVATVDFLRNHMGIPVPQVFAWNCWRDGGNVAGAEYMVMEKIQGHTLAGRWPSLSWDETSEVMHTSRQVRESNLLV